MTTPDGNARLVRAVFERVFSGHHLDEIERFFA
jgi:hypothetical protein